MAKQRYSAEEIIHKLREAEILQSQGQGLPRYPSPAFH